MAGDARLYEQFEPDERFTLMLEALARNDESEAERLTGSCPRWHYTQRDVRFTQRMDNAFAIMSVACIDLRCLWGKVESLEWAFVVARHMATHHNIAATFAFLDGERFARQLPQMDFFGKRPEEHGGDEDEQDDDDEGTDEAAEDVSELTTPAPMRASAYREGEYARRMMAVEDRMQAMTESTFGALLHVLHATVRDLSEIWTAYDRFCRDRLGVSAETMLAAWQFPTADEVKAMLKRYEAHVKPDPAKVEEYFELYCGSWDHRFGE